MKVSLCPWKQYCWPKLAPNSSVERDNDESLLKHLKTGKMNGVTWSAWTLIIGPHTFKKHRGKNDISYFSCNDCLRDKQTITAISEHEFGEDEHGTVGKFTSGGQPTICSGCLFVVFCCLFALFFQTIFLLNRTIFYCLIALFFIPIRTIYSAIRRQNLPYSHSFHQK